MPIYEYLCNDCENEFELIQSISAEPADTCPSCEGKSVQKLISNSSFVLKGTGWYVTDYKDNKKSNSGATAKKESKTEKPQSSTKAPATA